MIKLQIDQLCGVSQNFANIFVNEWLGWSFFICQQNLLTVRLWYELWFLVKCLAHALAKGLGLLREMGVQLILFTIWLTLGHLL